MDPKKDQTSVKADCSLQAKMMKANPMHVYEPTVGMHCDYDVVKHVNIQTYVMHALSHTHIPTHVRLQAPTRPHMDSRTSRFPRRASRVEGRGMPPLSPPLACRNGSTPS
jgi:hypothetical protein